MDIREDRCCIDGYATLLITRLLDLDRVIDIRYELSIYRRLEGDAYAYDNLGDRPALGDRDRRYRRRYISG